MSGPAERRDARRVRGEAGAGAVYITRQAEFSASHRLHNPELSDEENVATFRDCNHPRSHGHNYLLAVTVVGSVDPHTGMVMNLKDLKAAIRRRILDKCDHRHLDEDVDFLKGTITTTENLCVAFWRELEDELERAPGTGRLHSIRIRETRDNEVEYFGP
jgi:6-pyruvoyltetrahydropterin/6-carboxytetrahydropterin synthase